MSPAFSPISTSGAGLGRTRATRRWSSARAARARAIVYALFARGFERVVSRQPHAGACREAGAAHFGERVIAAPWDCSTCCSEAPISRQHHASSAWQDSRRSHFDVGALPERSGRRRHRLCPASNAADRGRKRPRLAHGGRDWECCCTRPRPRSNAGSDGAPTLRRNSAPWSKRTSKAAHRKSER